MVNWTALAAEAEGSFYLYNKDKNRILHAFEITQKLDKIVIDSAAKLLGIKVEVKRTHFTAKVDSLRDIPKIIDFYSNTFKGMKSIEYRIWAQSFNKMGKGIERYEYLTKVRDSMRSIRTIRLDKEFKIILRS